MEARPQPSLDRARISDLGKDLGRTLQAVLDAMPEAAAGPQALATASGTNKVFTSRLLKALRQSDPVACLYELPGPEPLRRWLDAVRALPIPSPALAAAERAVAQLEACIREEAGDRSALHAALAAWLPAQREEFAQARKQDAFRAWSQLKGAAADLNLAAAFLHPSATAGRVDVVWLMGLIGLRRLRPGATVKLATRRLRGDGVERAPEPFAAYARGGGDPFGLREFCAAPAAPVEARRVGETMHYLLGGGGFGLRSAADLLLAEVNRAELPYGRAPGTPPRLNHVFAEVGTPSRALCFDLFVHEDLFPGQDPELFLYDTALEGVADVNDRARDLDRLDLPESVARVSADATGLRLAEMPRYPELPAHLCAGLGWQLDRMRAWRCRIEFPPHGAQVVLALATPELPSLTNK